MAKSVVSRKRPSSQVEKPCKHCGKLFFVSPSHYDDKMFCSKDCRAGFKKANQLFQKCKECGSEFEVAPSHYGKVSFCSKKCRQVYNKNKQIYDKCAFCGKSFKVCPSHYGRVKYCSKKCRTSHVQETYRENRTCNECGVVFLAYKANTAAFCSQECYAKNKKVLHEKKCMGCGALFMPRHGRIKYCSVECYYKDNGKSISIKTKCSNCGKDVMVQPYRLGRGANVYCSLECKVQFRSEKNRERSTCQNCNAVFFHAPSRDGKFCSNDCMMAYRSDNKLPGPSYDNYAKQIDFAVDVRRNIQDGRVIDVKCAYCGKWHTPSHKTMNATTNGFKNHHYDLKFYCSDGCKSACPTFGQTKYPKGFKRASSREVSPDLRQMCLERDGWECQRCGKTEPPLHCHHVDGAVQNKIISNDLENVITLCKACHKEVHKQDGCRYHELQCKDKESCVA